MNLASIIAMISNFKTTTAGLAVGVPALIKVYHDLTSGSIDPSQVWTDLQLVLVAFGLVAASDAKPTATTSAAPPK